MHFLRLTGLKPLMGLSALGVKITDEQRKVMNNALKKYRAKVADKRRRTTHEDYDIGEEILVFSPKTNRFLGKSDITSFISSTENQIPSSYYVTFANNQVRKVNQA